MRWGSVQATINWTPRSRGLFAVCVALACVASNETFACYMPSLERTMFFQERDLASYLDAPVIVDVTVEAVTGMPNNRVVASARVNRAFKGIGAGGIVNISVPVTSCDRGVAVGVRGIVVGTLAPNSQGEIEIHPISERFVEIARRRRSQ
jgi:hypothetical protein